MRFKNILLTTFTAILYHFSASCAWAQEKSLDATINEAVAPWTDRIFKIIFFAPITIAGQPIPFILIWLAGTGIFLTFHFKFINLRALGLACRTVRGKYSSPSDPGEISHFQALTAALSATVGLGNIAGVAIAISKGGPGAAFWMIVIGFLGMTTKFAECTLGVRYRDIDANGKVQGGPMKYLTKGLAERGWAKLGKFLGITFAILCVGASLGGGNMFQINQACSQFVEISGGSESILANYRWVFGAVIAVLVAVVIIGGIRRIANVTSRLVPLMCLTYILGALVIVGLHLTEVPGAIKLIIEQAFTPDAYVGGLIGAMLVGIQRGTFSNEAGIGSAPIAHSAVKTSKPASEGIVALLEPFIDTIVVCSLTALVIVLTGTYGPDLTSANGIEVTSQAFASVISWFPFVLFVAVTLFAISTLLSWSYYGQQAWNSLFGAGKVADLSYKILFCICIVIGAAASLGAVTDFSDGMLLGMCFPNLIGVYFLLPVIREELTAFQLYAKAIDGQDDPK
ncbi:MAG: alanine:cation symporter family protein [Opitutales bacterium]|nr:alanine:cation symporter family protein [Opitutales bacterium]MDP4643026.1 alanine:cation symporter family protein [Opitutales bacterium]MDP4777932.1 alanine:cation symporter family protein [Opitutales bacterium]MDP4878683.1 alanine:cation symporter family protein [Opitutales bacterium]MDP4882829.1 alanine:cation symporter family protein [Opitutales bacterium]